MSSLVDAIVSSDLPFDPLSQDDATSRARGRTRAGPSSEIRSSSRHGPLELTSDADHMELDPDDEVVGSRGLGGSNRPRTDLSQIPQVTDEAGEQIMEAFKQFLEKYNLFKIIQLRF